MDGYSFRILSRGARSVVPYERSLVDLSFHGTDSSAITGMPSEKTLYRRMLPGGGFVNVDVDPPSASGTHRAYVAVERRSDPARRDGHVPPVVASAEGGTRQNVFTQLLAIAADNVAVARALLRWRSDGKARF